ncbi:MAG TPA: hypothetical protein VME66_04840 [Candidatus Acidoferrales bacterium]|nr:hypothetical protein [Candidatus Acidoferrales bacterium]
MSDVLVLNSTYEPLNLTRLARAVRLVFAGKAEVIHDCGRIASPTLVIPLPSVIRMLYYIARARKRVPLTKKTCCCAISIAARIAEFGERRKR